MRNSKFLLVALGIVVLVIILSTSVAFAGPRVAYTWAVADLSQGGHGGGALFTDGPGSGNLPFVYENGQLRFFWHIASWEYLVPGEFIDLCFDVHAIKGTPPYPDFVCVKDVAFPLPVTGTPLHLDVDGDGSADAILRVTPAN